MISGQDSSQNVSPRIDFSKWVNSFNPLEYIVLLGLLITLFYVSAISYLGFHIIAEFFSILVALGVFMISVHTNQFTQNQYLSFFGLSYLFIAIIDLCHTLFYPGILGIYEVTNPNIPSTFWIFGRYIEAISLLVSPLFLTKRFNYFLLFIFYATLTVALFYLNLFTEILPTTYIPGLGQTLFKKSSEYIVAAILILSLFHLKSYQKQMDSSVFHLVTLSILLTAISELCFTFYFNIDAVSAVVGHFLKVVSFFLIYKAIITTSLVKPLSLVFHDLQLKTDDLTEAKNALESVVATRTSELTSINRALEKEIGIKEATQQQLHKTYMRLDTIINTLPDIIVILDQNGVIVDFIGQPRNMLQHPSKYIGKRPSDFNAGDGSEDIENKISETLITGNFTSTEFSWTFKDVVHWYEARMQRHGKNQVLAIIRNISDQRRAEEESKAAKEEAIRANETKSRFLATMSHELRTPMNGIMGMVQLLQEEEITQSQRELVDTIFHSSEAMVVILGDILSITNIEAGNIRLNPSAVNLAWLLESICTLFTGAIRGKGLRLNLELDSKINDSCILDPVLLRQVLSNLVANAVKFTEKGTITVKATLANTGESTQTIRFSILDTGIGIGKEQYQHIFDHFTQVDSSNTRKFGGTGLGLSIVSNLVQVMGSQINLDSELGKGSNFWFEVAVPTSLKKIAKEPEIKRIEEYSERDLKKNQELRVLIVEDDGINQIVITRFLDILGFQTFLATNGEEALNRVKTEAFDLIIMDCLMPVMDGYRATKEIRKFESGKGKQATPIVALSAKAMDSDRKKCLDSGMDDFLAKPFTNEQLTNVIYRWLN